MNPVEKDERTNRIKELEKQIANLDREAKELQETDLRKMASALFAECENLNLDAWVYRHDDMKVVISRGGPSLDGDTCEDKANDFISRFRAQGNVVIEDGADKREHVFTVIRGGIEERINIRCKKKEKEVNSNIRFFYSVSFNVLEKVDWVIYLLKSGFLKLPAHFLFTRKKMMYYPSNGENTGLFDIDESDLSIRLVNRCEDVDDYYHPYPPKSS